MHSIGNGSKCRRRVLMSLGAILGLAGAVMGASAQRAEGKAREKAAEYNAQIMRNKAQNINYAKRAETQISVEDFRRLRSQQKAAFAASGARTDVGSPMVVQLDEISKMNMDILNDRRARQIEAEGALSGAEMQLYEGRMANRAGQAQARATLLGGFSQFALDRGV